MGIFNNSYPILGNCLVCSGDGLKNPPTCENCSGLGGANFGGGNRSHSYEDVIDQVMSYSPKVKQTIADNLKDNYAFSNHMSSVLSTAMETEYDIEGVLTRGNPSLIERLIKDALTSENFKLLKTLLVEAFTSESNIKECYQDTALRSANINKGT